MLTMTPLGPRQYVKMPLGLKDSGAVFQRAIHETLQDCPGAVPYIDNILVYRKTKQEHDCNLEKVLRALHSKNFRLQLLKCRFRQTTVPYLGHLLSGSELQPNPKTIAAIIGAPIPQTAQQLNSFLGLVGWYSDFIPDLATKAKPLRTLSQKGATFAWDAKCQGAFEGIK